MSLVADFPPAVAWSWTPALAWLERVWATCDRTEADPDARWHLLLGVAACHRFGGVNGAKALLADLLAVLPTAAAGDPQLQNAVAHLLADAGLPVSGPLRSPGASAFDAIPAGPLEFLYMNKADLFRQIAVWSALTDYGRRPLAPALAQTAAELCQVLPGVFAAESRTNDLPMVAGLLRLMVYLNADRENISQGVEYLAYQQRCEGSFGYANPLTGGAPATGVLQATAEALWALGEAEARLKQA